MEPAALFLMMDWFPGVKRVLTKALKTLAVVVFMPPAQEPGEPPMNMSKIMNASAAVLMPAMCMVLNPAVRQETD